MESTQNCGFVGGHIEIFFQNPKRLNFVEFYDIGYLNQKKHVNREKYAATANMLAFADRFKQVGLFNEDLKSSGDMEWGQRVASQGFEIAFAEDAVVKHPSRSSVWQIYKKKLRLLGGRYAFERLNSLDGDQKQKNAELFREIFRNLKPPLSYLRWRLSDKRLKGIHEKLAFIFLVIFMNYAVAFELLRLRAGGDVRR